MFFRKKDSDSSFDDFIKRAKKFSPFELEKYDEYADFLRENKRQAVWRRLGLRLVVAADTHGNSGLLRQRLSHLHKSYRKNYDNGTVEKCVYFCEYLEI